MGYKVKKEDLDKRVCDVMPNSNITKTCRDYIHQLDKNVYGDFAMTNDMLNSLSDEELSSLLGKLEFLSNK